MERKEVLAKVKNEVEALAGTAVDDPEKELFKERVLDSANILHIIIFMETEFGFKVEPVDITLESLGTINRICEFVLAKAQNQ